MQRLHSTLQRQPRRAALGAHLCAAVGARIAQAAIERAEKGDYTEVRPLRLSLFLLQIHFTESPRLCLQP